MKPFLYIVFCLSFMIVSSQEYLPSDSISGRVKKIREKVIYLGVKRYKKDIKKRRGLISLNGYEYGCFGVKNSDNTMSTFYKVWFTTQSSRYLNYERTFDRNGNVIKDVWFGKKDVFKRAFRFIYNQKGKVIKEVDSSRSSVYSTNYYYNNNHVNILKQNHSGDFFTHRYKRMNKKNVELSRFYYEDGEIDEYAYFYNDKNQLQYSVKKKKPSSLKDTATFKNKICTYDKKGRNIKTIFYTMRNGVVVFSKQIEQAYDDKGNVILYKIKRRKSEVTYHFTYDKKGRVVEKKRTTHSKLTPIIVEKYTYKNNRISKLTYFDSSRKKKYKVVFRYQYDDKGNWVQIIKNRDGKDLFKLVRQISYYADE